MSVKVKEKTEVAVEEQAPKQISQYERRVPQGIPIADKLWLDYVAHLTPDDETGAFLLPQELPTPNSSPRMIRAAIRTASMRAFGSRSVIRIKDYVPGVISGEMRILLPQGREMIYQFNAEEGWQATVVIHDEEQTRSFAVYYRQMCMNPIRVAIHHNREIDTSSVQFTPFEAIEMETITVEPELDQLIDRRRQELHQAYEALK